MIPHPINCYVIMVHYGDPSVTTATLAALECSTRVPDQVIIIDHAKTPFPSSLPTHHVVRPASNAGYAAGLNIGLGLLFTRRVNDQDVIVCMNNDALVGTRTIAKVMASAQRVGRPTLFGARWGAINPLTGRTRLLAPGRRRPRLGALSYIDGAFFAAPWSVFYQIKSIPDAYYLYWEEGILAARLRQHHIPSRVIPNLGVRHSDASSSAPSDLHTYYLVRNGAHYMQTYPPWPYRAWWRLYNRLRFLYHRARGQRSALIQKALRDALRGQLGPATLPPESS